MVGVVSLWCLLGLVHVGVGYTAPRCCAQDRWSAFLTSTQLRPFGDPEKLQIIHRFFYDFANKRWALYQIHPDNQTEAVRLVADYRKGLKYLIRNKTECTSAKIKAKMYRYCIPGNATYLGTYRYGENAKDGSEFDTWSYELGVFPLRNYIKVTSPDCVPMQESTLGVVRNTFGWEEGDPPCIPWQMPSKVKSGDCYRCHIRLTRRRSSTSPTQTTLNLKYVDIEKGIPTPESDIFGIPAGCKQVTKWGSDVKLSDVQRHFLMRFKAR